MKHKKLQQAIFSLTCSFLPPSGSGWHFANVPYANFRALLLSAYPQRSTS